MNSPIMPTYGRQEIAFVKGEGSWLIDSKGNRYLDALSGIAVMVLGHSNPAITRAITEQSRELIHTSNLYRIPNQEKLAGQLQAISGMDNMFFANSGAEANECAIKIARLHGHKKKIENPVIIVADSAFHGRTLATLTATGNRKVHAGFEPLVDGFVRVPFNDIEAIKNVAENNKSVVAIFVEPVQGEGGIRIPNIHYLKELRNICDQKDWLLMLDEIQTGYGRTGTFFSYQNYDVTPDIATLAKGLGNGVPIGVCLAKGKASELMQPGNHGSTFGGNPLVCHVASAVLDEIERQKLPERASQLGLRMKKTFEDRIGSLNIVREIRGIGLMFGIELNEPCSHLVGKALEKKLLINVTAGNVIRLLPPLTITDAEADQICELVSQLIEGR
ncbi:MAG: aspartate aminotransferase family protein [Pseudomonadota bacterium]|nr:aspartate aminotransferase family protein [Pseudomonadota bacterium]